MHLRSVLAALAVSVLLFGLASVWNGSGAASGVDPAFGGRGSITLSSSQNSQQAAPGSQVTFTVTITNNDVVTDNVSITLEELPGGWSGYASPSLQTVQPSQPRQTTVQITVAPGAPADTYPIRVVGTSGNNPSAQTSIVLNVEVLATYAVNVIAPTGLPRVVPGQVVKYTFKVENQGNTQDSFTIDVTSTLDLSYPQSTTVLGPGTNQPIVVTVTIPEGTVPGTDTMNFRASSQTTPSVYDEATVYTTVAQVHHVVLSASTREVTISPGDSMELQATATNQGNGPDTVTLSVTPPSGWTAQARPDIFDVAISDSETISVQVSCPSTAKTGDYELSVRAVTEDGSDDVLLFFITVRQDHNLALTAERTALTGAGGNTLSYKCTVTNSGNGRESVDLYVSGDVSHWASVTPTQVQLEPGSSAQVQVEVQVPITADTGQYSLTLTASPSGEKEGKVTLSLQVNVAPRSAISLSIAQTTYYINLHTSLSVDLPITVTNMGNGADTIKLTLIPHSTGYEGTGKLDRTMVTLDSRGDSTNVTLTVSFADESIVGSFDYTVRATSTNDMDATAEVSVSVIVVEVNLRPLASTFRINSERYAAGAFRTVPNRPVEFTFEVENQAQIDLDGPIAVEMAVSGPVSSTQRFNINSISAQGTSLVRMSFVPAKAGRYSITFNVDPEGLVAESDETDNVVETSIVVSNPSSSQGSEMPFMGIPPLLFTLLIAAILIGRAKWE